MILQFFGYLNSSKNITCPSGKLKTAFTSPIAKSTSPGYRTLLSLHVAVPNPFYCILILTVFFSFLTLITYNKRSKNGKLIAIYLNLSTYSDNRESENMKVRAFIAAMIFTNTVVL